MSFLLLDKKKFSVRLQAKLKRENKTKAEDRDTRHSKIIISLRKNAKFSFLTVNCCKL